MLMVKIGLLKPIMNSFEVISFFSAACFLYKFTIRSADPPYLLIQDKYIYPPIETGLV